jgi:hypothetical protein
LALVVVNNSTNNKLINRATMIYMSWHEAFMAARTSHHDLLEINAFFFFSFLFSSEIRKELTMHSAS